MALTFDDHRAAVPRSKGWAVQLREGKGRAWRWLVATSAAQAQDYVRQLEAMSGRRAIEFRPAAALLAWEDIHPLLSPARRKLERRIGDRDAR